MLENMLSGLIDKEKAIKETIENAIEDVCEELNLQPNQVFLMIKPNSYRRSDGYGFTVFLYQVGTVENGLLQAPEMVRKMELHEFTDG